jgi:hypothetical protein
MVIWNFRALFSALHCILLYVGNVLKTSLFCNQPNVGPTERKFPTQKPECDNVLPGQCCCTLQGVVMEEYGERCWGELKNLRLSQWWLWRVIPSACRFITLHILRPWRWRRHVPPKRQLTFSGLHGVMLQNWITQRKQLECHFAANLAAIQPGIEPEAPRW